MTALVLTQQTLGGNGATLSECLKYRYSLWRWWSDLPYVNWVMLNPSTADAAENDRTIDKCMKFARAWGYGGIVVTNLFAWRETDSKLLKKQPERVLIGELNDEYLVNTASAKGCLTIAAWGQGGKLYNRQDFALNTLRSAGARVHALKLSKDGTPWHPLYLRDDTKPFLLEVP